MGAHTEIHGADIGEVGRASSIGLERIDEPTLHVFISGANSFPMKANEFSMGSIWIPMHSIGFAHRPHVNSNAFHIRFLIDPIWIPIHCLTDFHMESDGFPIDLNLDSVRFPYEFPYGFQSIPCGLHE